MTVFDCRGVMFELQRDDPYYVRAEDEPGYIDEQLDDQSLLDTAQMNMNNPVFDLIDNMLSGVEQRQAQRIPERDPNPPGRSLTTAEENLLESAMEERAMYEAHEGKDIFLDWIAEQANVIADYAAYRRATCDPAEWDELQREIGI